MLKGISPLLSPELLSVLCRMGHGDEIVLADAHFPGETVGKLVLRADGLRIPELLDAILPLLELDSYVDSPAFGAGAPMLGGGGAGCSFCQERLAKPQRKCPGRGLPCCYRFTIATFSEAFGLHAP